MSPKSRRISQENLKRLEKARSNYPDEKPEEMSEDGWELFASIDKILAEVRDKDVRRAVYFNNKSKSE